MDKCLYCAVLFILLLSYGFQFKIYSVTISQISGLQSSLCRLNAIYMKCVCSFECLGSTYVRGGCTGSIWDTLSHMLHPVVE